jgi:hypothetical protein
MKKCEQADSVYATATRSHVHLVRLNGGSGFGRPDARSDSKGVAILPQAAQRVT